MRFFRGVEVWGRRLKRKGCCQACWRRVLPGSSPLKSLNRLHISTPGTLLVSLIRSITDIAENQNKKGNRPRQVPIEDYEVRRPIQYNRGPKFYSPPPQTLSDEEEKQQMVFHLNLYPRKKNKMSR